MGIFSGRDVLLTLFDVSGWSGKVFSRVSATVTWLLCAQTNLVSAETMRVLSAIFIAASTSRGSVTILLVLGSAIRR